jgi:hypothetical protein
MTAMTRTRIALPLVAAALLGLLATAPAQDPFNAPFDAMDTLNSAPTGGGGVGSIALDRARGVAANPGGPAAFGPGAFGPGALGPGGAFPQPIIPGEFGFAAQPSAPTYVPPATLRAWGGERVVEFTPDPNADPNEYPVSAILADAREIKILATAAGSYFNDGKRGFDAKADDDIYTNITVRRDYISPEAAIVRTRLIRSLRHLSGLNPREFNLVRVASTEPLSPLPKMIELEEIQDMRLARWMEEYLNPYRKDAATNPLFPWSNRPESEVAGATVTSVPYTEPNIEFVRAFVPPPPRAPNIKLPLNFRPTNPPQGAGLQQGVPGGFGGQGLEPYPALGDKGGGVTGEPIGNASSRYF